MSRREDIASRDHAHTAGAVTSGHTPGPEIDRLRLLNACYLGALNEIAAGITPPEQHGHYLAHREAVRLARSALRFQP